MLWIATLYSALLGTKALQAKKLGHSGYSALFVGDSHTKAKPSWSEAMVKKYDLGSTAKVAENGKTTDWMLANVKEYFKKHNAPDYVFVYGGANDAYNGISPDVTLRNLQAIIDTATAKGSKVIVVQGFDISKFQYGTERYPIAALKAFQQKYPLLQSRMATLKNTVAIVPAYKGFTRKDSTDGLHLTMPNYKVLGEYIGKQVFG